jgi:hypothetical protein
MAKKELRLAVVIYGGASLAVYMHGVTKELLKLVRASKVLHEVGLEQASGYANGPDPRPCDTEAVYFDILEAINRHHHFRVVIDVVAGASAGAINGVMLAKALVDDALLDAQTEGWLQDADVERLAAEAVTPWRKWYLYPLLRALAYWLPREVAASEETRRKITRLIRSSWFRPPFSGGPAAACCLRGNGSTSTPASPICWGIRAPSACTRPWWRGRWSTPPSAGSPTWPPRRAGLRATSATTTCRR